MYVAITYLQVHVGTEGATAGGSGSTRIMLHDLPTWLSNRPGALIVSVRPVTEIEPSNWVVCAAIRLADETILGPRHFDSTMHAQISRSKHRGWTAAEEGFIDKHGVFLTRREAWDIARAAGQIQRRVGDDDRDGGTLYSENLY